MIESMYILFCFQVLQCAQQGIQGTGVELNRPLVLYSKFKSAQLGLGRLATFKRYDIFKTDMQPFQSAIIFGAELMMEELVPKLDEMREGTNLICCRFPLPSKGTRWQLLHTEGEGIDAVWLYKKCPYVVVNSSEEAQ